MLSICERDEILMPRKSKPLINIVSKFNIFTSNLSFDEIYEFKNTYFDNRGVERKSSQQRKALYQRFAKTQIYTHGWNIHLHGDYLSGRVTFLFNCDNDYKPFLTSSMYEFIHGIFDIKFVEGVTLKEAEDCVYDKEINDLYEKDEHVYLKMRIDMRKIFNGFIGEIGDNYFIVYNKYWKGESVKCVYDLDVIFQQENEDAILEVIRNEDTRNNNDVIAGS